MNTLLFDSNNLHKKKPNFTNILKKKYPLGLARFPLCSKKIRCSSTDNYDKINMKNKEYNSSFSFSNLSPLHNSITNMNKFMDIKTYSSKNLHYHSSGDIKYFLKKNKNKNECLKKINKMLDSSISIFNKNYNNMQEENLMQKFLIYIIAFEDFIKLIEVKEEKDLLSKIKNGIEEIIKKLNYQCNKLKNAEPDFSNKYKSKLSKLKIANQKLIDTFKKKKENSILNKTQNSQFSIKNFFSEKNLINSVEVDHSRNIKKKNENENEEDLSDLESVRFSDKIIMKRTNSTKLIPKLDLSFFSLYPNKISKIKKL